MNPQNHNRLIPASLTTTIDQRRSQNNPNLLTILKMTMTSPTLKQIRPLAFILNVQMTIRTSDAEAFLAAMKPAYDAVLQEPECAFFNLGQRHPLNPLTGEPSTGEGETVISFSEGWNCTLDHFRDVQLKKEYYGPYQAATQPMYTKPRKCLPRSCIYFPCSVL